ncbi:MAG: SDR family NAD(P)-dependent oxidoreductase [Chitinophagales bacterium]
MKNFKDKIVVITGAGSGMGRAYAIEFQKLGAKLALNDFDEKALSETINILTEMGSTIIFHKVFDVSKRDAVFSFAEEVKNAMGNAHVVINNAGIEGVTEPLTEHKEGDFERIMNVNFYGVLYGCQAFLPQLLANDEAALVNVSSLFGLIGVPHLTDYCASKFAVRGLTESLMVELHDTNVSVHCVHPGGINTNIARHKNGQEFAKKHLTTSPEKIAKHVIKCIRKKKARIVYGSGALTGWFGSNFVPLNILKKIIFREMKNVV